MCFLMSEVSEPSQEASFHYWRVSFLKTIQTIALNSVGFSENYQNLIQKPWWNINYSTSGSSKIKNSKSIIIIIDFFYFVWRSINKN